MLCDILRFLRRPSIFVPIQEVDETQIAFERRQRTLRLQSLTPISPDRLRYGSRNLFWKTFEFDNLKQNAKLIVGSLKCDTRLSLRNKTALLYHVALCLISIQAACRTRTVASELDTLQSFKYLVFKPSGICVAAYFPRAPITRLIKSSKLFWKIILRPVLPQFIT